METRQRRGTLVLQCNYLNNFMHYTSENFARKSWTNTHNNLTARHNGNLPAKPLGKLPKKYIGISTSQHPGN